MLKRIEVKNFKSIKHLDYKCARLNLLTGLNGAGKSSFVQSLLLLRALEKHVEKECYEMPLCEIVGDDDEWATFEDLKYCYAKPNEDVRFEIDFDVERSDNDHDKKPRHIVRVVKPHARDKHLICVWNPECFEVAHVAESSISLLWASMPDPESAASDDFKVRQDLAGELQKDAEGRIVEVMKQESAIVDDYRKLWKRANMISAFRGRPKHEHCGNPKGSWVFGFRFNPEGDDVVGFLAEHGMRCCLHEFPGETNPLIFPGTNMHDSLNPDDDTKNTFILEQIQRWLNIISPGAKVACEKVEIGSRTRYFQSVAYGDKKFKPENVGFGVSDILPVLTTLLTSRPGDIVIIENPEAHLHPKGQAKMGELLARAAAYGVQLFVETHSDHVINGIRVAVADKLIQPADVNIAFFERREHGVSRDDGSVETETYAEVRNIKMDKRGFLSEYPEGFMDEWNKQLLELS